jgi:hypothetical protein
LAPETLYEITANNKIISIGFQRGTSIVGSRLDFQVSYREGFPNVVMQAGGFTEYSNQYQWFATKLSSKEKTE